VRLCTVVWRECGVERPHRIIATQYTQQQMETRQPRPRVGAPGLLKARGLTHMHVVLIERGRILRPNCICDVWLLPPQITWSTPRALVEPLFAEEITFLHKDYLKAARLVVGKATEVRQGDVLLASGDVVPFDYLVLVRAFRVALPA
jgi:hypothetical protein